MILVLQPSASMVLVVVPAYNEAKTIGRVIRGLFEHGFTNVVVVDDGSKDSTGELAQEAGATVLRHRINRGQGAALETGNAFARQQGVDTVVHFDADLQFNPSDITPALKELEASGVDILLGSRFLDGRSAVPWFKKYFILPAGRLMHRVFFGLHLTDAHNGFRIMTKKSLELIRITQDGMAHNTEILQQIAERKLTYKEFPIEVTYHEYGQGVLGGVKIMGDLLISTIFK